MTPQSTQTLMAREVLWTYSGVSEEQIEREFYNCLKEQVVAEIARRLDQGDRIWVGREMRLHIGSYIIHSRVVNIEPLLANASDQATRHLAHYRERPKDEGQDVSTFISEIIRYPDKSQQVVYTSLVGLEAIKKDLLRKLNLVLAPDSVSRWMESRYKDVPQMLLHTLRDRYPLFILEGEVGSGKTALARSVGDRVARKLDKEIVLFIVNAQVRGGGHVGELTQNISRAFTAAERCQEREQLPLILLIDEADALARARGGSQTHHEDDAGVNTLIQRIDRLRGRPIAVIFATNLVQSLDAAILRRADGRYHFDRPSREQRTKLLRSILAGTEIDDSAISRLVDLTEPRQIPGYGSIRHRYTYSDLSQRIIPRAIEEAIYSQHMLDISHLTTACSVTIPTPETRSQPAASP